MCFFDVDVWMCVFAVKTCSVNVKCVCPLMTFWARPPYWSQQLLPHRLNMLRCLIPHHNHGNMVYWSVESAYTQRHPQSEKKTKDFKLICPVFLALCYILLRHIVPHRVSSLVWPLYHISSTHSGVHVVAVADCERVCWDRLELFSSALLSTKRQQICSSKCL